MTLPDQAPHIGPVTTAPRSMLIRALDSLAEHERRQPKLPTQETMLARDVIHLLIELRAALAIVYAARDQPSTELREALNN